MITLILLSLQPSRGAVNFILAQLYIGVNSYRGVRKNLFDLRRCAVVHNLHVLARSHQLSAELQEAA